MSMKRLVRISGKLHAIDEARYIEIISQFAIISSNCSQSEETKKAEKKLAEFRDEIKDKVDGDVIIFDVDLTGY